MIAGIPPGEILAVAAAVWLAVALVATVVGWRRIARGNAALREARAIADLLAGGPAVPILVYPDDAIDADPRIATWLGLDAVPRRLSGLGGAGGVAAGDLAELTDAIARARTSGREFAQTIVLPGSTRVLSVRGQPYSVRGDERRTILLWALDISEQQHAIFALTDRGERLDRALERLSALIEAAPFPMWHRAPDLSLALVNPAYVRAIEADSAADVIARGLELIEPSGGQSPRASAAAARERQAIATRTAPAIVAGQRRMMRVADVPIGDVGVAGYALDVQELEDARADLRLFVRAQHDMFDRLSTGVAQFAGDHSLVFSNRHFLRLFALETEWLVDQPDFDRVLERMRETQRAPESRDFPGWKAARRAWFSTTEPIEESWQLPGGTHLRVVAQPLPDGGLLLIFEDRTELLQLAGARDTLLRVRAATFDHLFEAVGVFAADGRLHLWNERFRAVWDLTEDDLSRHPRIDALVQLMAPRLLDPTHASLIRELVRTATVDRQQRSGRISLIDGRHFDFAAAPLPDGTALFTLSESAAGMPPHEPGETAAAAPMRIRMADFVRAAIEAVRPAAREAGLTLAIDIAADGGVVLADRGRLAEPIDRLLRDAIARTPAGGRVLIESRRDGDANEIVIIDSGQGADAEDEALLTPIRQAIEAQGGALERTWEAGAGVRVTVRLPQATGAGPA